MTFKTHEALYDWLRRDAPTEPESAYEVALIVVRALNALPAYNAMSLERLAASALEEQWHPRVPDLDWNEIHEAIEKAQAAYELNRAEENARLEIKRRSADVKRAADRKQQAAEEDRRKREADRHAEQVKKLAAARNITIRQAQRQIREGTKDARVAEQMAEVLGGDATNYLMPKARPGRQPDLVAHIMRARGSGLSFADFARDDVTLTGDAQIALWGLAEELDDLRDFEALSFAAAKRGIVDDFVRRIWLEFVLWRIRAIADRAEQSVSERLDSVFDFG